MNDLPDEETVRSRRTATRDSASLPASDGALDETVRAEPARRRATFEPPDSGDGAQRQAVQGEAVQGETGEGETGEGERPGSAVDGSTIIARRESRRRADRARSDPYALRVTPAPTAGPTPGPAPGTVAPGTAGRLASAPDPTVRDAYGARSAAPVRAARATPATRAPQGVVDGAAVTTGDRRRGRRTALVVIFAAGAVAFAAAASLIAIALNP
jgi:hypothetical protein